MPANKAVLGGTLFVTFMAGSFTGYAGGQAQTPQVRQTVEFIYAAQFEQLEAKGYDDAEMAEARETYTKYLKGYRRIWDEVLESSSSMVDPIDDEFYKRMDALDVKHRNRTGKPAKDKEPAGGNEDDR